MELTSEEKRAKALAQRAKALAQANETRVGMADVKRRLAAREITLAEALADPRSTRTRIFHLLLALPRYGEVRARWTLRELHIPNLKRVGELTERQRNTIIKYVEDAEENRFSDR
jgi:DNA-binding transcriptional ArsR family regulator